MADFEDDELYETDDEYEVEDEEDELVARDDSEGYETEDEQPLAQDNNEGDRDVADTWKAPKTLPAATWERIKQTMRDFEATGRNELTVLVLGKPGNGTSSTVNALLAERAFDVRPSVSSRTPSSANVELAVRTYGNLLLRVVHTHSMLLQQRPNFAVLEEIVAVLDGRLVDVVLWVDRLDVFRVEELDRQLWRALVTHFGTSVFKRMVVCLTHGSTAPPHGYDFTSFATKRTAQLTEALKRYGAYDTPFVVIEHGSRCEERDGERVLPNKEAWMASLVATVTAAADRYEDPEALTFRPYNPNRQHLWLIPVLLASQLLLKRLVLDTVIERDGWKGDRNGEFDDATVRERKLLAESRRDRRQLEGKIANRTRRPFNPDPESLRAQGKEKGSLSLQYVDDGELHGEEAEQ